MRTIERSIEYEMKGRVMRLFFAVAAAVLALTGAAIAESDSADAVCINTNEFGYGLGPGWGGPSWGAEENNPGWQCGTVPPAGNNGHYGGKVKDVLTDGSCVSVRILDVYAYYGIQASSCTTSWVNYNFWDQNGNTDSFLRLERNQGNTAWYGNSGY